MIFVEKIMSFKDFICNIMLFQIHDIYKHMWFPDRVHQDCHVADVKKINVNKAAWVSRRKDECQVRLKGRKYDHWIGTEIGVLEGHRF